MFRLDSDGCRWVFSSLDPAEFCPTRRLSLVPFNLGANTPPLSAKSSAVGGRQLCTFESQEKRVCITYTKLTKHPHCWWLNCYYWQEPSATRMWFQFARCRSVLPKMADEIHALNLPSSLRITDILTWVWVKPGEHHISWQMDVHPSKYCILFNNSFWCIHTYYIHLLCIYILYICYIFI